MKSLNYIMANPAAQDQIDTEMARVIEELKRLRSDEARLSQAELAERLGLTQGQISRLERRADRLSYDVYLAWLEACGRIEIRRPGVVVGDPYRALRAELAACSERVAALARKGGDVADDLIGKLPRDLAAISVKPTLAAIGRTDSGKSSLLGFLLGGAQDVLPARYGPTTSSIVIVLDEEDRPPELDVVLLRHEAYMFKPNFDPEQLHDGSYLQRNAIDAGHRSILRRPPPGAAQPEAPPPPGYGVVFVRDHSVLRACRLVDLPGIGAGGDSVVLNLTAIGLADVALLAASFDDVAAGRGWDATLVATVLDCLRDSARGESICERLQDVFLVVTHAHAARRDVDSVLASASRQLHARLSRIAPSFLGESDEWRKIGPEALQARMFSFLVEDPGKHSDVIEALRERLGTALPRLVESRARAAAARQIGAGAERLRARAQRLPAASGGHAQRITFKHAAVTLKRASFRVSEILPAAVSASVNAILAEQRIAAWLNDVFRDDECALAESDASTMLLHQAAAATLEAIREACAALQPALAEATSSLNGGERGVALRFVAAPRTLAAIAGSSGTVPALAVDHRLEGIALDLAGLFPADLLYASSPLSSRGGDWRTRLARRLARKFTANGVAECARKIAVAFLIDFEEKAVEALKAAYERDGEDRSRFAPHDAASRQRDAQALLALAARLDEELKRIATAPIALYAVPSPDAQS